MAKHISSYVAKPVGIAECVMQFVLRHNTTCSMAHILSRSYVKAIALECKASQSSIQFGLIIRHTHYAVKERMSSNSLPINLHVDPCIWLATYALQIAAKYIRPVLSFKIYCQVTKICEIFPISGVKITFHLDLVSR